MQNGCPDIQTEKRDSTTKTRKWQGDENWKGVWKKNEYGRNILEKTSFPIILKLVDRIPNLIKETPVEFK